MYVTQHARARIEARMGTGDGSGLIDVLESYNGENGTVAYLMHVLPRMFAADDGSNGDTLVAVAVDGSVDTVYLRRSTQDMSAQFFGARKVIDMRVHALYVPPVVPTRAERREERVRNGRKMRVSGRSTLLLGALVSGQQSRRVSRRKRGVR